MCGVRRKGRERGHSSARGRGERGGGRGFEALRINLSRTEGRGLRGFKNAPKRFKKIKYLYQHTIYCPHMQHEHTRSAGGT